MNDDLKKYINNNRDEFDVKQPSPELWKRIQSAVPIQEEIIKPSTKKHIKYWSIAASTIILIGIGAFFIKNNPEHISKPTIENIVKKNESEKNIDKESNLKNIEENLEIVNKKQKTIHQENNINSVKDQKKAQIKYVTNEKNNQEKEDFLQLLNDQNSTSNRIKAIAKLSESEVLNQNEIELIRNIALKDENTVVRLNAIEILSTKLSKKTVSSELTNIFLQQDNPIIQMELIGIISHLNNDQPNPELIAKLQEIVLNPTTQTFVKEEAYAVLLKKDNK